MRSFIKFGILSGGGWLLDCFILLLLTEKLGLIIQMANFISSSVAAVSVFSISRFFVFNSNVSRPVLKTMIYFLYTCAVIFLASVIIGPVAGLVNSISDHLGGVINSGRINFFAKVLITPPQLLANFMMSRYLVECAIRGK